MKRLIISDIHANLPAMEAVVSAAGHFDDVWFLGDIIGCGPYPAECCSLLMDLNPKCVMGNHDKEICVDKEDLFSWDTWTYNKLSNKQIQFIRSMPQSISVDGTYMTHMPEGVGYFHPSDTKADDISKAFNGINENRILFAHCHHQMDFSFDKKEYHCIRAVGQMRDHDPRAGFTIMQDGILTHHRVEYDIDKLLFGLDKIGLEEDFIARWKNFVKTAYDEDWSRE